VGMGGILLIFLISGLWGYSFLKRDRLIDMIKE
jgi:hypothetical protein